MKANHICKYSKCNLGNNGQPKQYYACDYCDRINSWKSIACCKEHFDLYIEEEKNNKSSKKKATRILSKVLSYSLLLIIVGFFGVSLVSRFSNDQILVGDSTLIVIASGSMSKRNEANTYLDTYNLNNQFDTYDIIGITRYNNQSEVNLYDVVAFKGEDNITYIHRIIDIKEDGTYITRGASNAIDDNVGGLYKNSLKYSSIIGKYNETRIRSIGVFIVFLQSNSGIITIISIIYCMLMFDHFRSKYYDTIDERQEKIKSRGFQAIDSRIARWQLHCLHHRHRRIFSYHRTDIRQKFYNPFQQVQRLLYGG